MLAIPQTCTEFYKRAFVIYSGSVLRNSLPLEVRQLTSLNVFKPTLKTFISIAKLLKLAIRNFYTRLPCIAGFFLSSFLFNCVRGTRTEPLICVGCFVHNWVSCAINKEGFLTLPFRRRRPHTFASLWGACLSFASLWSANSCGDSCFLGVHLSKVCWGLIFCLRKAFIF